MTPLYEIKSFSPSTQSKNTRRKYFLVFEGSNTELDYFSAFESCLKKLKISNNVEIVICDRTSDICGNSNPKQLLKLAKEKKAELKERGKEYYDKEYDKFVLIFDIDVYKTKEDYLAFLAEAQIECSIALTNSCFEVWLLLHKENSFNLYVKGNEKNILKNIKTGKSTSNTFTSKLFSDNYKFNPKKKHTKKYISLLDSIDDAIKEEKNINNDIKNAFGNITSNIGELIEEMRID